MDVQAVITEAISVLIEARAPVWLVLAIVLLVAVARVVLPKIKLTLPRPEPAPVVDEGGVQHEGTPLPTDPNREDLDYGGSG